VGCTEKHKYDFAKVTGNIFDAHPKELIGVKLQQTVFLIGLEKYIGTVCMLYVR